MWSRGTVGAPIQEGQEPGHYTLKMGEMPMGVVGVNLERGLGPIHVKLTIIFCRVLQVPLLVGTCSIPWLEMFFHEHVLRSNDPRHNARLQAEELIIVEDSHQPSTVQLTVPRDSWKAALDYLLPLLEGKQFERGGFVTSHSDH